jgi:hypothetical protein
VAEWKYLNKQDITHEISEGIAATDKSIANLLIQVALM